MTKLSINTFQRVMLINIVGAIEGNAAIVRKAVKLLEALDMTEAEKELVGMKQTGNQINWLPEHEDHLWEIELKDPDPAALLKEKLKAQSFSALVGRKMLAVYDQLDIE